MENLIDIVKNKTKESENIANEIKNWVSIVMRKSEDIESFGAVIVLKDGSVETYDESLRAIDRLTLVGGIEALKHRVIRENYDFE